MKSSTDLSGNDMYTKILVPLDGSETSWLALAHAAPLASWSGATVVVLHCIEELRHTNGFEGPASTLARSARDSWPKAGPCSTGQGSSCRSSR